MKDLSKKIIFYVIVIAVIIIVLVLTLQNNNKSGKKNPDEGSGDTNNGNNNSNKPKPVKAPSSSMDLYKTLPSGSFPLKKGQKSKLVFLLQYSLNLLYGTNLILDGDFGSNTQQAVSKKLEGIVSVPKDTLTVIFIAVGKHPQCDPAIIQAVKDINLYPTYYAN